MSKLLFSKLPIPLQLAYLDIEEMGFSITVLNKSRGFCCYRRKLVVIPAFAVARDLRDTGYLTYYTAHEFAHVFAGPNAKHGPEFMAEFKRLCPTEFQIFEYEYKSKNAFSAGVVIDASVI